MDKNLYAKMVELYFYCFRKASETKSLAWFHLSGSIAFLLSLKKHWQRGNKKTAIEQIPFVFLQLWESLKAKCNNHKK
jgi:hypothetical protein